MNDDREPIALLKALSWAQRARQLVDDWLGAQVDGQNARAALKLLRNADDATRRVEGESSDGHATRPEVADAIAQMDEAWSRLSTLRDLFHAIDEGNFSMTVGCDDPAMSRRVAYALQEAKRRHGGKTAEGSCEEVVKLFHQGPQ